MCISTRLVEVNLEEGETLMFEVNQQMEILGNDVQKSTMFFFLTVLALTTIK